MKPTNRKASPAASRNFARNFENVHRQQQAHSSSQAVGSYISPLNGAQSHPATQPGGVPPQHPTTVRRTGGGPADFRPAATVESPGAHTGLAGPLVPQAPPQAPPPEAQMQGAPVPGMPVPGMPVPGMPMQGMPMQGMPMQGMPMPMQGMPMQGMPMQGMPMQGMPMQGMPIPGVPTPGVPMQGMQSAPTQAHPMQAQAAPAPLPAPKGGAPGAKIEIVETPKEFLEQYEAQQALLRNAHVEKAPVGVLITAYRRIGLLGTQVNALLNQSAPASAIVAWVNAIKPFDPGLAPLSHIEHITTPMNLGPWLRFHVALELGTKFVAILDDDCVPGSDWLEGAMQLAEGGNTVVGAAGIVYQDEKWDAVQVIGPGTPSAGSDPVVVDRAIKGWVLERELLSRILLQSPLVDDHRSEFWSIHLSAALQREGVTTKVLPYDPENNSTWGTADLGTDDGLGRSEGAAEKRAETFEAYRRSGWKLLRDASSAQPQDAGATDTPA